MNVVLEAAFITGKAKCKGMRLCHGMSGSCLGLKVRQRQIMGSTPGCGGSIGSCTGTGLCGPEGDTSAPSAGSSSIMRGIGCSQAAVGAVRLGRSWRHSADDGGDLVGDSGVLAALPPPRKTRAELMKDIDAEYYGYRDEDDGILEPLEQEHEKKGM